MFPMFAPAMASAGPFRHAPRAREGIEDRLETGWEGIGVGHPQHMLDSGCCRKMVLRPLSTHCGHWHLRFQGRVSR
jgi:hypothetical protein